MLNLKENKKLSRAELKSLTGGAAAISCDNACSINGEESVGCPTGKRCRVYKCSHDPLLFGYKCF